MIAVGTRVKVLYQCPLGRWERGETGVLLKNDFDKYHYKVEFDRKIPGCPVKRVFYFYDDEIGVYHG